MGKIGLVMSGGGARGVAHLGAIKAFEERGLKPDIISGVSSGAIVGALYASGMKPEQVMELLVKTKIYRYIRPAFSKFGFLNIEKLLRIYQLHLPIKTFEELYLRLYISAADLREGKTVYFEEGDLIKAILASTCLPVIFAPLEVDNRLLVDGGIMNNLPVEPLIDTCELILGVHVNPANPNFKVSSIKSMIERTFHLAIQNNVRQRAPFCHIFIEPPELIKYGLFDIAKAEEIFKLGYTHACNVLKESEKILLKHNL
ncbi:MAG TPA: patatin-like phospholipase family protein [Cytophagaceae bacterium]